MASKIYCINVNVTPSVSSMNRIFMVEISNVEAAMPSQNRIRRNLRKLL